MNLQQKLPTTADEFLRWNEGREGKREFVRGRVVEMMINTTRNHARLAARLVIMLGSQLDLTRFDIGAADFGVATADGIRFPDVFVDRRGPESRGTDLAATEPVLLAEILSASSYGRDFVEKLADYTGIGTLQHYLILSQEEPRVWLWSRNNQQEWEGPREIAGADETIDLQSLAATLPLATLYAGIGPA